MMFSANPSFGTTTTISTSSNKPPGSKSGKHSMIWRSKQTEQKSMREGGFSMKKFFKGWTPSCKSGLNFDPRSTIKELRHAHDVESAYMEIVTKCQQAKTLWEDPDFPAEQSSLFFSKPTVQGKIVWKRAKVWTLFLLFGALSCGRSMA